MTENLKTILTQNKLVVKPVTAERGIHAAIFFLLLVGLATLSAYIVLTYVPPQSNLFLFVASVPLSWGIILLAMYVCFGKLDWKWWS